MNRGMVLLFIYSTNAGLGTYTEETASREILSDIHASISAQGEGFSVQSEYLEYKFYHLVRRQYCGST